MINTDGNRTFVTPDVARFTRSVIRAMTLEAERQGALNLSQGMPDFAAPEFVKRAACEAILADRNQCTPPFGARELREAVASHAASFSSIRADAEEEVTITCGSTEATYAAMRSLTAPGDEVIIPVPAYENYWADCALNGVIPRFVHLRPPLWRIDLDELNDAFGNRTRLILLCNPNNPTGTSYTKSELEAIAQLCRRWNVAAITDEIYEHIVFDGRQHHSLAACDGMYERTVTIGSASKTFGVTGWRIGTVIAPRSLTAVIRQIHDYLTICAPAPLQLAVAKAYHSPLSYYRQLAVDYQERRDYFTGALATAGFGCHVPEGAYYVLADVRRFEASDELIARRLLHEAGVASVPAGCFFGEPVASSGYVRFCFCKSRETLTSAAERLQQWSRRSTS